MLIKQSSRQPGRICRLSASHELSDAEPSAGQVNLTRKGEDRKWRHDQLVCIDKLPATKLDTLKMAVRFLVLHRDRSIRPTTEGLGSKPFRRRVVMLVNEHTLSANEMVAAFAAENGLAKNVGTRPAVKCWAAATFRSAMDSCCGSRPPAGTRGAALSSKAKVSNLTSMFLW